MKVQNTQTLCAFGLPCYFRCHHTCVTPAAKRKGEGFHCFQGSACRQGNFLSTHRGLCSDELFPRAQQRQLPRLELIAAGHDMCHPPAQQAPGDRDIWPQTAQVAAGRSSPALRSTAKVGLCKVELWAGRQPSLGTQEQQGRRGCWSGSDLN